jgi:hypothetical protein
MRRKQVPERSENPSLFLDRVEEPNSVTQKGAVIHPSSIRTLGHHFCEEPERNKLRIRERRCNNEVLRLYNRNVAEQWPYIWVRQGLAKSAQSPHVGCFWTDFRQ